MNQDDVRAEVRHILEDVLHVGVDEYRMYRLTDYLQTNVNGFQENENEQESAQSDTQESE